jgi:hypothetical protein
MAQQAAERVREETGRVAGQAKQQAQTFVSQQKDLVADRVTDVADVLRETVGQLDERVPGAIANYAHQAIDRLDDAASYLREQDLNSLIADAEDFARRQPLLFLAGSMAVGFALARFLKSSAQHRDQYGYGGQGDEYRAAYGSGGMRSGRTGAASQRPGPSGGAYGGYGSGASGTASAGAQSTLGAGSTRSGVAASSSGAGTGTSGLAGAQGSTGQGDRSGKAGPATSPGTGR